MNIDTRGNDLFFEYYARWITVYKKGAILIMLMITKPFSIPSVMTRSSGRIDLFPYFAFLSMC